MKHVIFATGSDRKIRHMRQACEQFGIIVEQQDYAMDEIQAHDPRKISEHKAEQAFKASKGAPVVINDAYWSIPALNGFPGGYMKDVCQWLTADDWIALLAGKADRRVCITETVIYKDHMTTKTIARDYWLDAVEVPYPQTDAESITHVVAVDGMTIAQARKEQRTLFRETVWLDFAQWFATYEAGA